MPTHASPLDRPADPADPADLAKLDQRAALAARYARYSLSAGGLSSVVGGVLLLGAFAMNAWVELETWHRVALAASPVAWLVAKELLRRLYYQRDGVVIQRPSVKERRWHFWGVAYLAVMAVLINAGFLYAASRSGNLQTYQVVGYVALVSALPVVAWRWMWSVSDFLVGVLLLCQAAVVLAGSRYPPIWMIYVAAMSFIVVYAGIREHRDYLKLRRELPATGAP